MTSTILGYLENGKQLRITVGLGKPWPVYQRGYLEYEISRADGKWRMVVPGGSTLAVEDQDLVEALNDLARTHRDIRRLADLYGL